MLKGETPSIVANNYTENLLESEEFRIFQNNYIFLILIGRTDNSVTIKCSNYSANLNNNEVSLISGQKFQSINALYNFIINIFKNNKVKINLANNEMNLDLSFLNNNNQLKSFQISLGFSNSNTDYFINYLFNKLTKLESENNTIKMNYQNLFQNYQMLFQELNQIKSQIQLIQNNNINLNNNNNNINNMNNIIMGNVLNNQNMNISLNQINFDENNTISILFREPSGSGNVKTIDRCNLNDTIRQLMQKYRERIEKPNFKFYLTFNAKVLDPNLTLKQAGLTNLTTLYVMKGDPPIYK